ncbi:MAG TPA: hypothetical protein DCY61_02545 [Dehalococcoidia bacterium]|nr:hypothetical protein [Dehalococcoidia bacterium]
MLDYRFERECRTPYSEAYDITLDETQVGRVDLHFAAHIVSATLCVGENMTAEEIRDLIDSIDEELVLAADVVRDDFVVTVYQGREAGVFSDEDEDFMEELEEEEDIEE